MAFSTKRSEKSDFRIAYIFNAARFATSSTNATGGIDVTEVQPGSAVAQRGLRSGDIIIKVNRQQVQNLQQLQEIADINRILFLLVQRGDRSLVLQIR